MTTRREPTVAVVREYGMAVIQNGRASIEIDVEDIGRVVGDLLTAERLIADGGAA